MNLYFPILAVYPEIKIAYKLLEFMTHLFNIITVGNIIRKIVVFILQI